MSLYGEELEQGFWCEAEGIYYTDPDEHPKYLIGTREEVIEHVVEQGHYGYACPGAALPPMRAAIVVLLDELAAVGGET